MVGWACAVVVGGFGANLWRQLVTQGGRRSSVWWWSSPSWKHWSWKGGLWCRKLWHFSLNCYIRAISHSGNVSETYFRHFLNLILHNMFLSSNLLSNIFPIFPFIAPHNIMSKPKSNTFRFYTFHKCFPFARCKCRVSLKEWKEFWRENYEDYVGKYYCCYHLKWKWWKCCCKDSRLLLVSSQISGKTVRSSLELSAEFLIFCLFYFGIQQITTKHFNKPFLTQFSGTSTLNTFHIRESSMDQLMKYSKSLKHKTYLCSSCKVLPGWQIVLIAHEM